jgi:tRNA dimethylallyltransferase
LEASLALTNRFLNLYPLIAILGPTGAGKSDLAVFLAQALCGEANGEIVNCDSVQVYRGLDIGSAKTPHAARLGIPHHLIDIVDPGADLTAGEYARIARQLLEDAKAREALPILAGGTGFYLRALIDGLSPMPGRDEDLRVRLSAIARRRPLALHRILRLRNPVHAARIHPNDHQKLIRAIEVISQAEMPPRQPLTGFRVLKLALNPERTELYVRLNQRCEAMFANGLLEETSQLLASGVPSNAKSLQSLGYKQALQVLEAGMPLALALNECQTKTRQYAKRQLTWFRAESGVEWLNGFGTDPAIQTAALIRIREFLANLP